MITLYSGAPGSGKTLKMLFDFLASADGSRPIFVYGIEGLVPSDKWSFLDNPQHWAQLPFGSLVLIDEAQKVFRPRRPGDPLPSYISDAEEHRHLGIDLVLTTQFPMLVDAHMRRLVSDHQHLVNVWGMKGRSSVYEWDECQDDPKDHRVRRLARKFLFTYPKSVYPLYKSAQIHTKKPRVPKWFKFGIPAILLLLGLAGYFAIYAINHFGSNGSRSARHFLASHSPALVPLSLTSAAAHAVAPAASAKPYYHRPLSHFDDYSLPVRNHQALSLPKISAKYRVVGDVVVNGVKSWIIVSKGGSMHSVPAIRCSNFEGLEVCRWGGGYVAAVPVDRPATPVSYGPSSTKSSKSKPVHGSLMPVSGLAVPASASAPVHHHSILLPAHSIGVTPDAAP